ncbi:hypothetical protein J1N35_012134 [Gossypium stocksii]|uniref:Uncharacterized protein n=1 Tax=Gossypium stocksii TaxID=47602 RepID=A0A9D3W3Z8_9ROSI|nr:hypothetical protein J1N35_012134 [Gossypium stocksii]
MERIRLHNSSIQEDKYENEDTCKDNYSESSIDSAQLPHSNANDYLREEDKVQPTDLPTTYTHAPKILLKIQIDISGELAKISATEATLNWQTKNALAQNHTLKRIDSKILAVEAKVDDNTKMVKDLINILQKRLDA